MIPSDATKFLLALGAGLGPDERIVLCCFHGDPGHAEPSWWKPLPWHPEHVEPRLNPAGNGYVTVGAFGRAEDGTFRRRANCWTGGLALMVDDVGTKVDRALVEHLRPSARILTSPGNEQWWYFFDVPERDPARFDAMIRAFIAGTLLGKDPGMAGIARVGRLPGFQNMKPEYGGFTTVLTELSGARYTFEQVRAAFGLELQGRVERRSRMIPEDAVERMGAFTAMYNVLERSGQLKRSEPDKSGWTEMHCPWVDEHTGGVDNGAGVREPAEENGFTGAFVCHHGSHKDRTLRHLTDWVYELTTNELEAINDRFCGIKPGPVRSPGRVQYFPPPPQMPQEQKDKIAASIAARKEAGLPVGRPAGAKNRVPAQPIAPDHKAKISATLAQRKAAGLPVGRPAGRDDPDKGAKALARAEAGLPGPGRPAGTRVSEATKEKIAATLAKRAEAGLLVGRPRATP